MINKVSIAHHNDMAKHVMLDIILHKKSGQHVSESSMHSWLDFVYLPENLNASSHLRFSYFLNLVAGNIASPRVRNCASHGVPRSRFRSCRLQGWGGICCSAGRSYAGWTGCGKRETMQIAVADSSGHDKHVKVLFWLLLILAFWCVTKTYTKCLNPAK